MAYSKKETLVANPESDKCHCPICLEKVRNPKYLPCYHTFCEPCIQTYISSTAAHKENETLKSIECPVCRRCIDAPRCDISNEEWASELPQNKLILTMSVDPKQDENKYCMICKRQEKTVPAKHWCKACMEAICEDCKLLHRAVKSLQNHEILNFSNIKEVSSGVEVEEVCLLHQGKILDVFCHDHQKLCCSICHVKQHKICKNVDTVEDIALEIDRDSVQNIALKYIDLEKSLEEILLENLNKVAKLNTRKQEICMNTEEKVQEIKSLLDNAHAMWQKRFEQNHADSIGNIELASDELKRFSTTVHEARTMLQSVLKSGSSKQLFITNCKLQNQVSDHITRLKSLDIWNFSEDYKQHNSDFLSQISNAKEFEDVELSKLQSWALERILWSAQIFIDKDNVLQKRKTMSQKGMDEN
ncbi:RING finger protein 207-like [Saccostrea echinata]|uniref:RING finger protein 207-like n=1 Tax=Saccostrea echinata TaxID=191078 RepID=UPI002A7FC0B4|nr:RING finger protein 207-like [Saccostrea echinata]